jgi:hypothetical protein
MHRDKRTGARWPGAHQRAAQRNSNAPAGHTAQDCRPDESLYVPPGHKKRSPATQCSPGAHSAAPERVTGDATPPSGVEYHPGITAAGASDPGGQNTVAFPHGTAVPFTEPGGQK